MDTLKKKVVMIQPLQDAKGRRKVYPGGGYTASILLHPRTGDPYSGLTVDENKEFEKKLGITLDKEFWENFQVRLGDTSMPFNTADPMDELRLKFLTTHSRIIAPSKAEIKPGHQYVIIDEEKVAEETSKQMDYEFTAYGYAANMSLQEMISFLKLYQIKADTASPNTIKAKIREKILNDSKLFCTNFEDKDKVIKQVIFDSQRFGIVKNKNGSWYLGDTLIGASDLKLVEFFKDPTHAQDVDAIKHNIDQALKTKFSKTLA